MTKAEKSLIRVINAMDFYNKSEGIAEKVMDEKKPHQKEWKEAYIEATKIIEEIKSKKQKILINAC